MSERSAKNSISQPIPAARSTRLPLSRERYRKINASRPAPTVCTTNPSVESDMETLKSNPNRAFSRGWTGFLLNRDARAQSVKQEAASVHAARELSAGANWSARDVHPGERVRAA